VRTGPQGAISTVDRSRGSDGLIDKSITDPQGGVTTVDRTRGSDGADRFADHRPERRVGRGWIAAAMPMARSIGR